MRAGGDGNGGVRVKAYALTPALSPRDEGERHSTHAATS